MEKELLTQVISQGAWACLFVWLLFDTRKESKEREEKLHSTIDKNQVIIKDLAEKFNVVEDIKDDVDSIKIKLFK